VGQRNHRLFVLLLLSVSALSWYIFWCSLYVLAKVTFGRAVLGSSAAVLVTLVGCLALSVTVMLLLTLEMIGSGQTTKLRVCFVACLQGTSAFHGERCVWANAVQDRLGRPRVGFSRRLRNLSNFFVHYSPKPSLIQNRLQLPLEPSLSASSSRDQPLSPVSPTTPPLQSMPKVPAAAIHATAGDLALALPNVHSVPSA
jgi:hypothetical protein